MFDSTATDYAIGKLMESGLFSDEQLEFARTWFQEFFRDGLAYMTPNKVGELVGMHGRYVQQLCRDHQIECQRAMFSGWWLIPAETIIELRKRVIARKGANA